jgi:alkylhydroperoxidase family enzyme
MAPRIEPKPVEEWDERTRELLVGSAVGGGTLNIFGTLAHHPDLLRRWLVFGTHVLGKSALSGRHRELVILRIGWLCRAPYEWGQHVVIGRLEGLTDADLERVAAGPEADGWDDVEVLLMRATDELFGDQAISRRTWQALAEHYDAQQMLDLVFTVGQYQLVSMALNSCGVERDDGVDETTVPFPSRPDT